ncbi:MAG: hypothetical protein K8S18_03760 [Desulfobacula sp.]|nr:hypothetical protein [Desulfobacula sp.]
MLRNKIIRVILKLQGHDLFKYFDEYCTKQYLPTDKLKEIQANRLKEMLLYSYNNVPYYTHVLEEVKVVVDGNIKLDNFSKIPILTKDIIREHFDDLKCKDLDKRKWYLNTSGGSTGEPVKFIQDDVSWDSVMGCSWFFSTFAGKYPGDKEIKLWGSERDILKGSIGINAKLKNMVFNRILLNSFKMSEDDMMQYVDVINKNKPILIEAYVQSIYELSKFIKKNNLKVHSPKGVITSAGTLYPDQKKLIEDVFNITVYNRYGSREVGGMACSCEKDEGLHLNIFDHYIEILNDDLEPCKPGEVGQVYVTTLNNYVMPLIRYQIGDMAVPAENEQCSCGRGLPLIKKIEGRVICVFKTKEGKIVPGEFFIHFIGVVFNKGSISKFQVIQEDYDSIKIKVVVSDKLGFDNIKNKIINSIKKVMGKDCKVEFEFVDDIVPLKSGKYLYTVSEVK